MTNEQLIDQIYAAFASGDFDGFRALLSDDYGCDYQRDIASFGSV